ncbi:MAG: hypothetical protein OQK12_10690 [Motiliproteus sp.]|nr:hypothetical protein [Motiliproteus sp.]MCW9054243.1 hypothetical protein [Motiliproteus sp.]
MNKSKDFLFKVTDIVAWGLIAISLLSVVAAPFSGPSYYESKGVPVDWVAIATEAGLNLCFVIGLLLYLKRKIIGFVFIVVTFVGYALLTGNSSNYWLLLVVLFALGLPWLLSRRELKE